MSRVGYCTVIVSVCISWVVGNPLRIDIPYDRALKINKTRHLLEAQKTNPEKGVKDPLLSNQYSVEKYKLFEDEFSIISRHFESVKNDPTQLRIFVESFPKGAELHNHIEGGTFVENLLEYTRNKPHICLDITSFVAYKDETERCPYPLWKALNNPDMYSRLLSDWSLYDYDESHAPKNHINNAIDTFFKFFPATQVIVEENKGKMLADQLRGAYKRKLNHLELIVLALNQRITNLSHHIVTFNRMDFHGMFDVLKKGGLDNVTEDYNSEMDTWIREKDLLLHCNSQALNRDPACDVSFGFLPTSSRTKEPKMVFTQTAVAFLSAKTHPHAMGVNTAGPENNPVAVRDYDLHMEIFGFFHSKFPSVNISLHAGEFRQGQVPPMTMSSGHIIKAIEIGGANRIGHGVVIGHEGQYMTKLQKYFESGEVAIEICLTSNAMLLGLYDEKHPFNFYFRTLGAPVVLNTDDMGVLRTDINQEWYRAIRSYNLTYNDLKILARNSLSHSFLPGKSLFDPNSNVFGNMKLVSQCQRTFENNANLPNGDASCAEFLINNRKATQQIKLESALRKSQFPSLMSYKPW